MLMIGEQLRLATWLHTSLEHWLFVVSAERNVVAVPEMSSITEYRLTDHARYEMERRQITEAVVAQVLSAPEQVEVVRSGRVVCQSRVEFGKPARTYLVRVFVDIDREPAEVVTVYRTSKMGKYWRDAP